MMESQIQQVFVVHDKFWKKMKNTNSESKSDAEQLSHTIDQVV